MRDDQRQLEERREHSTSAKRSARHEIRQGSSSRDAEECGDRSGGDGERDRCAKLGVVDETRKATLTSCGHEPHNRCENEQQEHRSRKRHDDGRHGARRDSRRAPWAGRRRRIGENEFSARK